MGITYLRDPAFWHSAEPVAPGSNFVLPLDQEGGLDGLVFFQTSGSMGQPCWIGLSREALLLSAAVVNRHLQVDQDSCWGLSLPLNHVGGFGVLARAYEAGCELTRYRDKWAPARFTEWVKAERVSHVSLVPTQVHDLVREQLYAPSTLKVAVIGGGGLDGEIGRTARALGWPVLASYGMTEAGSQIATQGLELLDKQYQGGPISILPHWQLKIDDEGRIAIRGKAMFAGKLIRCDEKWVFSKRVGDWYVTNDLGKLEGNDLLLTGRADALVKILGELVDPMAVERELAVPEVAVVAVPDGRKGKRLIAVCDQAVVSGELSNRVKAYNREAEGFRRIDEVLCIDLIPRSDLGKVRRLELAKIIQDHLA